MIQQKLPKLVQDTIDWYINQEYLKEWKGKISEVHIRYTILSFFMEYPHTYDCTYILCFGQMYNYRILHILPLQNIRNINGNIVGTLSPNYIHQILYP